ncbi:MAG TPA: hypothetical protein VFH54_06900 [Mycobacteriales bacterium]|nr:hypothetical protein [Mycobacteriales bacterium]
MGFDDLVAEAMPFLATEELSGTAGASWEWSYELTDNDGALVDFTGCTGTCTLATAAGATPVLTPTVTFPSPGVVKVTATPTQTAAVTPGRYLHEVELVNAASRKIKVVGAGGGRFVVKQEVA